MNKFKKLLGHIKHFLRKSANDNISAIAGQSAFYIILSFVPFLMFAFAIISFLNIPQSLFDIYIADFIPKATGKYIQQIISSSYEMAVGVAFTTIVLALWSAGKGIYSITEGIKVIYKIPNKHNWFVKRLLSMGYTFVMFVAIVLSLAVFVILQFFEQLIDKYIPFLPNSVILIYACRYIIIFVVLVILIALALKLYLRSRVEDKRFAKFRVQLPGAILTTLIWTIMSKGISVYVNFFGGFSIYGGLATAAVIMVWLYFTMCIFLYCIQFNYIYRHKIYDFRLRDYLPKFKKKK